jgi:peptidoglycan/LPS O-acetylase OafA/YrhL
MVFLDNVRLLMVLCVVVAHAAAAYTNSVPWWYVRDARTGVLFDVVAFVLDIFQMPVLFFIAGYFALPSLKRRGFAGFLRAKGRRLGIPLVLVGVFLAPVMPYIRHLAVAAEPSGFLAYWWAQMKTFVPRGWEHASTLPEIVVFALSLQVRRRLTAASPPGRNHDPAPRAPLVLAAMLVTALAVSVAFGLVNLVSRDGSWVRLGGLLLFQPTRVTIYTGMFCLGVFANTRNWFAPHPLPGSWRLWLAATLPLALLLLVLAERFYTAPVSLGLSMAHGFLRSFLCLAFLGLFASVSSRHWSRPAPMNRVIAESSYDIYLVHLPVVVTLQWALLSFPVPSPLKWALIAGLSVLLCLGLSRLVIRPHPKAAVMALIGSFMVFSLVL